CDRKGAAYRMGIDRAAAAACFVAFGVLPAPDIDAERARQMNVPFDKRYQRTEEYYEKAHPKLYDSYRTAKVRLMPSLKTVDDIPGTGRNLIVLASVDGVLHFRIFHEGKQVLDTNEDELKDELKKNKKALEKMSEQIEILRARLNPLWSQDL